MSSETTPADEQDEPTFRVGAVQVALAAVGIEAHRDAVVRASEKFVHVSTQKSENAYRSWTQAEIDRLVVAFRLRHEAGLIWPRVAELLDSGRPIHEVLDDELAALSAKVDAIAAKVNDLTAKADAIADKRAALARLHDEFVAA